MDRRVRDACRTLAHPPRRTLYLCADKGGSKRIIGLEVGTVLMLLGATGRAIGGRRHYY